MNCKTRRKKLLLSVSAGVGLLLSVQATAHHGWGGYNAELRESMTVTQVRWINPHDLVRAMDAAGKEWTLLLGPPARNRRFGFGPGTVELGDVVEILGARHPTKNEAKVHTITVDGEEVYRYMYSSKQDSIDRLGGTVQKPHE